MEEGIALGISGTPTFLINGEMLVGAQPYDAFETAIESALADSETVEEVVEEEEEVVEEVAEETTEEEETTDECGGCPDGEICYMGACVEIAN